MTDKNNGGPAFPENWNGQQVSGMTLRDYFAAKAMSGICANRHEWGLASLKSIAVKAYDIADAMLEARND